MFRAARLSTLTLGALFAALPLLGTGCTPQDRYDNLMTANRSLQEQLAAAEYDRDQMRANLNSVQSELDNARGARDSIQGRYNELDASVSGLGNQNDEYLRRIAQLELGPLPTAVRSAIEDLAIAHPEVLSFDAARGMLRFASDFTFDLGSVDLRSEAASTLASLASVLNDSAARGLEAHIVGHTDNVPIGRPETRRNHPTNTHLSVHRAISVRNSLVEAGVDPARIQVAGFGEFRPLVPNARGGAAANRRVEIFLTAMTNGMQASSGAAPGRGDDPTAPGTSAAVEPMK